MLFRHREEIPQDQEGTRCNKGGSKAMYDLAQSRTEKCAINTEDTVLKFNLCFDQSVSGVGIVDGAHKFVREVTPIQDKEKASENKRDQ